MVALSMFTYQSSQKYCSSFQTNYPCTCACLFRLVARSAWTVSLIVFATHHKCHLARCRWLCKYRIRFDIPQYSDLSWNHSSLTMSSSLQIRSLYIGIYWFRRKYLCRTLGLARCFRWVWGEFLGNSFNLGSFELFSIWSGKKLLQTRYKGRTWLTIGTNWGATGACTKGWLTSCKA